MNDLTIAESQDERNQRFVKPRYYAVCLHEGCGWQWRHAEREEEMRPVQTRAYGHAHSHGHAVEIACDIIRTRVEVIRPRGVHETVWR